MAKTWTEAETSTAIHRWREAFSLEQIGVLLGFAPATVSAKLREAGEDMVTYGSEGRAGLEAPDAKPRRMGEPLERRPEVIREQVMYQPHELTEQTIEALLDNDLAATREEAVAMMVDAGSRDVDVVAATRLNARIQTMRQELRQSILVVQVTDTGPEPTLDLSPSQDGE